MSNTNVTDSLLSIIPIAATVAVVGHTLKALSKPIKKSKNLWL